MRARHVFAAGLAGLLLAGSAAHGAPAPKPQIVDPAGDSRLGADTDLVSVAFSVVKKSRKLDQLLVTVTTAGPAALNPGSSYNIKGEVSGCGSFIAYSYWGAREAGASHQFNFIGCGPEADPTTGDPEANLDPTATISGNTLTYALPFKDIPKEIKLKTRFSELVAWTAVTEPVVGYTPADFEQIGEAGATDWATGTSSFQIT